MDKQGDTSIMLVTKGGHTVYPHQTDLQPVGKSGPNYRLDSWQPDGTVYVYEYPGIGRRERRQATEFGLTVQKR